MIIIRADGNSQIGMGHIMRCMAIAKKLVLLGNECVFFTADSAISDEIIRNGFQNVVLDTEWQRLEAELPCLLELLQQYQPSALIIDSYYVTKKYLSALTAKYFTVYIDDVAVFEYPVDCIINYNIYADTLDYSYCKNTLLGMDYVPLRDEFRGITPIVRPTVEDVFISTGGADPTGFGYSLVKSIIDRGLNNSIKFHIVAGNANTNLSKLLELADNSNNIIIHNNVTEMAKLMQSCDLAISASGSTLYELCACGVPTINYVFADNQIMIAETFANRGLMRYAGDIRADIDMVLDKIINNVIEMDNHDLRSKLSEQMRFHIDGNGTERTVSELKHDSLKAYLAKSGAWKAAT